MSLAIKPSLSLSLPSNREAAVVAIVANNLVFEYRSRMRSSDLGRAFRDLYIFSGTCQLIRSTLVSYSIFEYSKFGFANVTSVAIFGLAYWDIGCPIVSI